jgi:hypothetical protein
MACARVGYGVLGEDTVFVRIGRDGLEFWGMPWTQRLLPDAPRHFPELAGVQPRRQPNGELKIEIDLDVAYPGAATPTAAAGAVVLLERGAGGPSRLEPIGTSEEPLEILWAWDEGWSPQHDRISEQLSRVPAYRLYANGSPEETVAVLGQLIVGDVPRDPALERA